jgi:hypothetical protein
VGCDADRKSYEGFQVKKGSVVVPASQKILKLTFVPPRGDFYNNFSKRPPVNYELLFEK